MFCIQHKISVKESSAATVPPSTHSVSAPTSTAPLTDATIVTSNTGDMTVTTINVLSTTCSDTSTTTVITSTVIVPHHEATGTGSSRVKLPKLEPKKFNGDLTKLETFWSSFKSSIHLYLSLTPVDEFHYSLTVLEDPAFAAFLG